MALEGLHDLLRRHGERRRIAEALQRLWKSPSSGRAPALGHSPIPCSASASQGKRTTGIDLALGRDVGMAHDVARLDRRMAREDAAAELDQRLDLRGG